MTQLDKNTNKIENIANEYTSQLNTDLEYVLELEKKCGTDMMKRSALFEQAGKLRHYIHDLLRNPNKAYGPKFIKKKKKDLMLGRYAVMEISMILEKK